MKKGQIIISKELIGNAEKLGLKEIEGKPGFFHYNTHTIIDLTASGETTEAIAKNMVSQLSERVQTLAIV